jgi:hypothetical protein
MPPKLGHVFDKMEAEANFNYPSTAICFFATRMSVDFEKSDASAAVSIPD